MANGTAVALDLGKTADCKTIAYHFSMGIGRMRQISTKVVDPNKTALTAQETADRSIDSVILTTAKASELRSQKRLIDSPELDEIRSQDSKLANFIKSYSASAGAESTRFVLSENVETITRAMEAYRTIRRPQLVAAFMAKYRAAELNDFAAQRAALGNEFSRKDYKPADEVERGFSFTYTIRNVGTVELAGLPSWIIEQETAKEQEQRAAAVDEFKGILRFGAMELIDALYNQVKPNGDSKKRRLVGASVDNLIAFVTNWDKQDVAGDLGMAPVIADLRRVVKGLTPEMLKESESLKLHVASQLEGVKKNLHVLVQATGRKFR